MILWGTNIIYHLENQSEYVLKGADSDLLSGKIWYCVNLRHCEATEYHACQICVLSCHIAFSLQRERIHEFKNP